MSEESVKSQEPVSVVFAREVKPGRIADFELWLKDISQEIRQFDGYSGMEVIRVVLPDDSLISNLKRTDGCHYRASDECGNLYMESETKIWSKRKWPWAARPVRLRITDGKRTVSCLSSWSIPSYYGWPGCHRV